MAQVNAGDVITIQIDGLPVTAKIEDASKSESIMAKIETSQSPIHHVGQVYEFERSLLKT